VLRGALKASRACSANRFNSREAAGGGKPSASSSLALTWGNLAAAGGFSVARGGAGAVPRSTWRLARRCAHRKAVAVRFNEGCNLHPAPNLKAFGRAPLDRERSKASASRPTRSRPYKALHSCSEQ
jgi:hypothetical protein